NRPDVEYVEIVDVDAAREPAYQVFGTMWRAGKGYLWVGGIDGKACLSEDFFECDDLVAKYVEAPKTITASQFWAAFNDALKASYKDLDYRPAPFRVVRDMQELLGIEEEE